MTRLGEFIQMVVFRSSDLNTDRKKRSTSSLSKLANAAVKKSGDIDRNIATTRVFNEDLISAKNNTASTFSPVVPVASIHSNKENGSHEYRITDNPVSFLTLTAEESAVLDGGMVSSTSSLPQTTKMVISSSMTSFGGAKAAAIVSTVGSVTDEYINRAHTNESTTNVRKRKSEVTKPERTVEIVLRPGYQVSVPKIMVQKSIHG
jgi:hypothetical protein